MSAVTHILLVHDDEDGRFLIGRSNRASLPDAVILQARGGHEALSIIARITVDAVVTDQRMAGMSGTELVRQIRATDSRLPILMTTGDEHAAEEAISAVVTEFYGSKDWLRIGSALELCLNGQIPAHRPATRANGASESRH